MARINRDALLGAIRKHCEAICQDFLSAGERHGNQWVVGSSNGDPGQSLRIELCGDKVGVAYDFATGQAWDLINLLKDRTGLRFVEIALRIGRVTGVNVEEPPTTQYTKSKKSSGPRYRTDSGIKPCDWDKDYKLSAADIDEFAQWRGYSREFVEWAADQSLIGRKRKFGQWALPYRDEYGVIVAAHVRYEKNKWKYLPPLTDLKLSVNLLVVGDPASAEKVFFAESQWDGFAIADRLGIQYGEPIALACTRGSSNATLVSDIQTNGAELYVVPQNDDPGHTWAEKVGASLTKEYRLLCVPEKYHDANDWICELTDGGELVEAMKNAETKQPHQKQKRIYIECHPPSYFLNYVPPPDLVLCGKNHIVRGGAFVIGGPPGVGKSRASIALAVAGARRVPWFGLEVLFNFKTLIIQSENGRFRLQQELSEINEPLLEDYLLVSPPPPYGLCFSKTEFRDQLRYYQDYHGPQLVILDPWNGVAMDDRMRDYREAFDTVREVFQIGSESGPSLGILAHTRKPILGERASGRALLNLLAGSYVLGSIPRTVFIVQSASDDVNETQVVWTCCKNNDGVHGPRSAWERRNGLFVPVKDFDWDEFDCPSDGRSGRKLPGTIDDLLGLIPVSAAILRDELYEKTVGLISRDDVRDFIAQLLREGRIYIWRLPNPGKKRPVGYSRVPQSADADASEGDQSSESDDCDIEDDPR
jgi:hypothetical protein